MTAIHPPRFHRNGTGTAYEPPQVEREDDRSMSEIMGDLTTHARDLLRGEVDLIKAEAVEKGKEAARYVAYGVAAGVLALVSLIFLGHTVALAFDTFLPQWVAYLITFALFIGGAAVLGLLAKRGFQNSNLAPTEGVEQAKEDLQWVATHR